MKLIKTKLKENKMLYKIYLRNKLKKAKKIGDKRKKMNIEEMKKVIDNEYKERINENINWNHPKKYTELIQWNKLNNIDPRKTNYSDKILVRSYVEETIGDEYLIPMIGAWNDFNEINFNQLPSSFVLKTNHGSGTNIIVKNKRDLDLDIARIKLEGWMDIDYGYIHGFELHYSDIKRKIFAEEFIDTQGKELEDYKFLCFNGVPYYCWVDVDRFGDHRRNIYDLNWNLQPWIQTYPNTDNALPKPQNWTLMVELAEKLASDFPHVRVDLYNVEGEIYFGEMTFTNGCGYEIIHPRKYDTHLGDLWID
ncbi:ATP-grasp fold amidoligase family protein [Halobacillus sp. KGW1]|uniref:ATP-grasp fold amidoligase family protein n=1 Tax=Halobacillus sp. KGW1 TaxID=1793726 RepID=UPI000B0CBEEF|nr:ATP-grasp fold amidoligase family protein [Halobacillus sp. KGW1]